MTAFDSSIYQRRETGAFILRNLNILNKNSFIELGRKTSKKFTIAL